MGADAVKQLDVSGELFKMRRGCLMQLAVQRVWAEVGEVIGGAIAGRVAGAIGTGLAGAVAYDGVKRILRSDAAREGAVRATAWGLRGVRAAEAGTERARLSAADIVSEARERLGEQTPAPGTAEQAGPGHAH